jgi:hypothetical protein
MPSAVLTFYIDKINVLRNNINFNESLAAIIATNKANPILTSLINSGISPLDRRILEYCTTITRLYSLFEAFVEETIADWISKLPYFYKYDQLDKKTKTKHQRGIAYILNNLDRQKYSGLNKIQLVKDFYDSLNNNTSYCLQAEAFCFHDNNLRYEQLLELLSGISIAESDEWLRSYPPLVKLFGDSWSQNSVPHELNNFIENRNEVSHGTPINICGKAELFNLLDFIENLFKAIYELFHKHYLSLNCSRNTHKYIGDIKKTYSNNIAIVNLKNCSLRVNDTVTVKGNLRCYTVKIISIVIHKNIRIESVNNISSIKAAIKFDDKVKEKYEIYHKNKSF